MGDRVGRYPPELRERAVRMVAEVGPSYRSQPTAAPDRAMARRVRHPPQRGRPGHRAARAGGDHRDRELLLLLGSLEDLTLYAAVALTRSQPDSDQALFDLARRVAGWGRIHAVGRLAGTQDPQIKAWLLRHGFRKGPAPGCGAPATSCSSNPTGYAPSTTQWTARTCPSSGWRSGQPGNWASPHPYPRPRAPPPRRRLPLASTHRGHRRPPGTRPPAATLDRLANGPTLDVGLSATSHTTSST